MDALTTAGAHSILMKDGTLIPLDGGEAVEGVVVLHQILLEHRQALSDIREHVRRYNGKPFLPKDVATRVDSIHSPPWYDEVPLNTPSEES